MQDFVTISTKFINTYSKDSLNRINICNCKFLDETNTMNPVFRSIIFLVFKEEM